MNLLLLEHTAVLDQPSGDQQEMVPKCERSYLHVFARADSSWESPGFYHGCAVWLLKNPLALLQMGICLWIQQCTGREQACSHVNIQHVLCLPAQTAGAPAQQWCAYIHERGYNSYASLTPICQVLVVFHSWKICSAYLLTPWPVPQPPCSFPRSPVVQPGLGGVWKCHTGWSRVGPCWRRPYLPILQSISVNGDVLCALAEWFWKSQAGLWNPSVLLKWTLAPAPDWLAGCFALIYQHSWCWQHMGAQGGGKGEISKNNYKGSHLNDQVFSE